ncbi:hypothetical protein A9Q90_06945 [Gammaproteobacteria bacterium 54_18_T64]|nr:hypothetical protein A9Q90_06945 [Gammaproteobacteria bacterium 54_18_T64]
MAQQAASLCLIILLLVLLTISLATKAWAEATLSSKGSAPLVSQDIASSQLSKTTKQSTNSSPSLTTSTPSSAAPQSPSALSNHYATLLDYETEGPYHQNASEVLYSLGLALQQRGQHDAALQALRRAMHINRVNNGLNSLSQAPMLRGIIDSQKSLVHIEGVTASYKQFLGLHIATYGKHDPRLIPLLNELGMWHLDAYQFDDSETRIDHLTSAYSLVISALKLSETQASSESGTQIEILRTVALVNFFLSRHQGDEWSASTDSFYSLSADGFATTNPQRTGILSGASFRRGRVCHERIVELTNSDAGASLHDKIQAQTELADWYLLFNHKTEAMARYQQVLTDIAASDQAETLHRQIFATPRLLPALRMERRQGAIAGLFMSADMDISRRGWGKHIDAPAETQLPGQSQVKNKRLRYKMIDAIKGARFRPHFVDNKAVGINDATLILPFIH